MYIFYIHRHLYIYIYIYIYRCARVLVRLSAFVLAVVLQAWRDLEVAYGNEDTFKDMLRIKRRQATWSFP